MAVYVVVYPAVIKAQVLVETTMGQKNTEIMPTDF